jgi:hypothetical protein
MGQPGDYGQHDVLSTSIFSLLSSRRTKEKERRGIKRKRVLSAG